MLRTEKSASYVRSVGMRGPLIVLNPCAQSHPFDERRCRIGGAQDPLKIGRSVARLKPTPDNAIFDCKVLSRNHAILWYHNGQFYLKDTKSSNGTFVNNERLAVTGEDSEPKQIYTGDIIQFGVEIVENTNKVAHGCIFAMVRLYDENGDEVEPVVNTATISPANNMGASLVTSHQLFQMQQFLKEALLREKNREEKLCQLEALLESADLSTESSWKAFVNEDRLLTRIATLEEQLSLYTRNKHTDALKLEMEVLIADKAKLQAKAREDLIKAQEERAEAELRLADTERSLVSTEEDCHVLRQQVDDLNFRLTAMLGAFEQLKQEKQRELAELDAQRQKEKAVSLESSIRKILDAYTKGNVAAEGPLDELRSFYFGMFEAEMAAMPSNVAKETSPEDNLKSVLEAATFDLRGLGVNDVPENDIAQEIECGRPTLIPSLTTIPSQSEPGDEVFVEDASSVNVLNGSNTQSQTSGNDFSSLKLENERLFADYQNLKVCIVAVESELAEARAFIEALRSATAEHTVAQSLSEGDTETVETLHKERSGNTRPPMLRPNNELDQVVLLLSMLPFFSAIVLLVHSVWMRVGRRLGFKQE